MYRFPFERIVYIQAITGENWCRVFLAEPLQDHINPMDVPLLLNQIFSEIKRQIDGKRYAFFRCGKSALINPKYLRMIDVSSQTIILSDGFHHHEVHVSRETCKELKARMEEAFTA